MMERKKGLVVFACDSFLSMLYRTFHFGHEQRLRADAILCLCYAMLDSDIAGGPVCLVRELEDLLLSKPRHFPYSHARIRSVYFYRWRFPMLVLERFRDLGELTGQLFLCIGSPSDAVVPIVDQSSCLRNLMALRVYRYIQWM